MKVSALVSVAPDIVLDLEVDGLVALVGPPVLELISVAVGVLVTSEVAVPPDVNDLVLQVILWPEDLLLAVTSVVLLTLGSDGPDQAQYR